jgi:hypothetical protein
MSDFQGCGQQAEAKEVQKNEQLSYRDRAASFALSSQTLLDDSTVRVDNDLPPLFEFEEDMTNTPQRLTSIENRLNGIDIRLLKIEEHLGIKPKIKLRDRFSRFWQEKIVPHPWISLAITLILTVVSIIGGGQYKYSLDHKNDALNTAVDERIETILKAPKGVLETLATINQTTTETSATIKALQPYIQMLVTHQFDAASKLPTHALADQLPSVKALLTVATDQKIEVQPQIAYDLSKNLLKVNADSESYWPVAAQLISYRSSLQMSASHIKIVTDLPPCKSPPDMDDSPDASVQFIGPDGKAQSDKMHVTRFSYHDCSVQLDGRKISGWDCTHCLIRYSGGPLSMRDVHFQDCLFIFDFPQKQPPTPDGRRFGQTLLASDLKDVRISTG